MEMMIAIFILVVTLTATIVLVATSIRAGRDSINRLIATNLAREGIEVVRNIRDSNWIEPTGTVVWTEGLESINDGTAIPVIRPHSNPATSLNLDFTQNNFGDPFTRVQILNDIYEQGGNDGQDSNFFRMIYFSNICQKEDGSEDILNSGDVSACNTDYEIVGKRVVVEVRWPDAGSGKRVQVEERFYNWQSL